MAKQTFSKRVLATLNNEEPHVLIIAFIPSHDRRNKPINNQEIWAHAALETFAALYGGATAFQTFKGIYRSETGEDLWDEPILVESYADREHVEDTIRLERLGEFLHRMKRDTNQETVLLVIDNYRHFV